MGMDQVVPVIAALPAWRRQRARRQQLTARDVVEEADVHGSVARSYPRPSAVPAKSAAASVVKRKVPGGVDAAVLVDRRLPGGSLYANAADFTSVMKQLATDLNELNGATQAGQASQTVNSALEDGAILGLLSDGVLVAVYTSSLRGTNKLTAVQSRALQAALSGVGRIDPDGEVRVGGSVRPGATRELVKASAVLYHVPRRL